MRSLVGRGYEVNEVSNARLWAEIRTMTHALDTSRNSYTSYST